MNDTGLGPVEIGNQFGTLRVVAVDDEGSVTVECRCCRQRQPAKEAVLRAVSGGGGCCLPEPEQGMIGKRFGLQDVVANVGRRVPRGSGKTQTVFLCRCGGCGGLSEKSKTELSKITGTGCKVCNKLATVKRHEQRKERQAQAAEERRKARAEKRAKRAEKQADGDQRKIKVMLGEVYGVWQVNAEAGRDATGRLRWACTCQNCGRQANQRADYLNRARKSSGGCRCVHGRALHGMREHPLYAVWASMRARCRNPKLTSFQNYGGRGITVCSEWDDPVAFIRWGEANGYAQGLQVDRIDNDGGYSPENCRFVTAKENMRNTRRNRIVEVDGREMTVAEAAEVSGVGYATIATRARRGMSAKDLIAPVQFPVVVIRGEEMRPAEAARRFLVDAELIRSRLGRGISGADAVRPSIRTMRREVKGENRVCREPEALSAWLRWIRFAQDGV